ncbi:MAG: cyclic nucleotide-binding domain-containing protein [Bauldia sp.]
MDPRAILKSTSFFRDVLDDGEIDMLAARAHLVAFQKGATPIEEDGPGHSMFVIVSGAVSVTVHGEDEPVAVLGPGDIFGEMSLLTGNRRSATVTAVEPVEVLEVSKQALAHVLARSPSLVGRFVEMLARRQRELDKLVGGNGWGMLRPGKAELANMISSFFGRTG